MQSVSTSIFLLAVPFFGLVFFALWKGRGVDARFFGFHFKADPEPGLKRRRRKTPRRPSPKPPPDKPG